MCLCDLCDSTESRPFVGRESPAPGLICIWRTRLECDDGEARLRRAREPSSVLTVTHVACDVPNFPSRQAVASFVMSTIERCHARIQSLLDSDLAAARKRLVAADRARIERLSRRDEAIASEIASMLRARTGNGGMFQPLLFEDIAIEKTTMTGQAAGRSGTWAPVEPDADADANADVDTAVAPPDAARRTTPSLAMVLVLR